ncbi:sodium channel and clathrin linker 1-like isoform X2 [Syngnathoides biaculeatus]|uniref:sodium channel and clathrin linker 1-like isoform X2 n=1 Tax=Syngnathoides biaculeatus TaxID=300417 RepID=UPI002ADE709E|nr:sodium channel and clathrin linker 1-like isoform X2 [Syngnathoides biaculeatus]
MPDVKEKLESDNQQNERLSEKQSAYNEPQSEAECTTEEDEALIQDYETLAQLFKQERLHAMEMWQKAAQEAVQFQELYHKAFSDGQQADSMTQKLKNQLVEFIRQSCKLKEINREVQLVNKHLQMAEKEQNDEIEELHSQLRKTNYDLRTATDKMDEMTEQLECLELQLKRKEDEVVEAQSRGEKQVQQLQSIISQQEEKLKAVSENAFEEQTVLETKNCHKHVVKTLLREMQKTMAMENKDKAIQQFIQEAAVRARKEIDNVREQCNVEIQQIVDEVSHLQMECAMKESQIERCKHEKKALEKELEKVTKYRAEQDLEKIIALHLRCLNAERTRDDMSATLKSTQSNIKKFESECKEELCRSQAEIQCLQSSLAAAWKDCDIISEERIQLQQENLELQREMNELQKSTILIQNQAKNRILEVEQECKLKEQTFNTKMMALEERSHNLNADRMNLLTAHQKSIQRSKDETTDMTNAFEARIQQLTMEMNQHKQRLHDVELQLRNNQDTITEYGSQLAEYQEKYICLQRRVSDAEQRAAIATQQLSVLTSRRRSSFEAA